jgi:hypothetical protein
MPACVFGSAHRSFRNVKHLIGGLVGCLVLLIADHGAPAAPLCKPTLSLRDVVASETRNLQKTWSAVLLAEASRCSTTSGLLEIQFTRSKEGAPELHFVEQYTWVSGRSEISLEIWWDEWIDDYQITRIASCPCRE